MRRVRSWTDTNMALTDLAIKRLPGPKILKLSDGGGVQLWITPDGAKRWRLAHRFGGAQKTFAIGVYPEVGVEKTLGTLAKPPGKPWPMAKTLRG